MSWLKHSASDQERLRRNIKRYAVLKAKIERLQELAPFTHRNTHQGIEQLLSENLVKANPPLEKGVRFLISGENNQSVVRDNPKRAAEVMQNMIAFINAKIKGHKKELNVLRSNSKNRIF